MTGFITFQEILDFGLSRQYLKVACHRFRENKSTSWRNYKFFGQVQIEINTIPTETREKYGIPDAKGWELLKKYRKEQEKKAELERQADVIHQRLKEAVTKHPIYFDFYIHLLKELGVE